MIQIYTKFQQSLQPWPLEPLADWRQAFHHMHICSVDQWCWGGNSTTTTTLCCKSGRLPTGCGCEVIQERSPPNPGRRRGGWCKQQVFVSDSAQRTGPSDLGTQEAVVRWGTSRTISSGVLLTSLGSPEWQWSRRALIVVVVKVTLKHHPPPPPPPLPTKK